MSIGSVSSNMSVLFNTMKRPQIVSEETQENLLKAADKDGNSALSKDEFTKFTESMDSITGFDGSAKSEEMFNDIDTDGDGSVTFEEMSAHREKMLQEISNKFGGDQMSTMDQVNEILSQTQQTLMDMMDSNSDDDDETDSFGFLSNEWSAKIQEYLAQQQTTLNNGSTSGVDSLLNSVNISELV